LNLDDIFRGDLNTTTVIENGLDLTAKIGTEYNAMTIVPKNPKLLYKGIYHKASFNLRFRNKFTNPTSLDHNQNFLITTETGKNWYIDQTINLGLPIEIWKRTLANFYTLGGLDSIRGYKEKSVDIFENFFLSI